MTALVVAFAWFNVSLSDGVGDRTYQPATAAEIQPAYEARHRQPAGRPLARLAGDRAAQVQAKVGIGELKIIVPHDGGGDA